MGMGHCARGNPTHHAYKFMIDYKPTPEKWCWQCRCFKELDKFSADSGRYDGKDAKCKRFWPECDR